MGELHDLVEARLLRGIILHSTCQVTSIITMDAVTIDVDELLIGRSEILQSQVLPLLAVFISD